jgi:hypothetical protein
VKKAQASPAIYRLGDEGLFGLFHPGLVEKVCDLVRNNFDEVAARHGAALAQDLRKQLLVHVETFIDRLFESERGSNAEEYPAADGFREQIDKVAAWCEGGKMDEHLANRLAGELGLSWTKFIAHAAAYLMYDDLPRNLERAEAKRQTNAKFGSAGGKKRAKKYAKKKNYKALDTVLDGYLARGEKPIVKALVCDYKLSDPTIRDRMEESEKRVGKNFPK